MATAAVALSLVLGGCGGGSDNDVMEPPPPPPEPMPVDASEDIPLSRAQHAALLRVLPDTGDSVELGDGDVRAGVTFTCMSDYPCTITVENSAGTIVAKAHSQRLPDGMVSGMATGLAPDVDDTFAELNPRNADSVRVDVVGAGVDTNTVDPNFSATELIGMGIGGPGVLNADGAGLRSDFQANGASLAGHAEDTDNDAATFAIAAPGASPDLRMGTTITGAMDAIDASDDMAPAPDGWGMKTLFRDWGDTAGDGDGGFETAAIVVKNLGEGTPYPFDRKLKDKYVNMAAQNMFALSIRANGDNPGVVTLGTSVHIGVDAYTPAGGTELPAAASAQWAAMVFDSESLVAAQSQDLLIDVGETFTGTYFGAPGQFQCITGGGDTSSCALVRNDDGTVGVHDTNADPDAVASTGSWSFTPDDGAMITVPDQDWMAYGAWLTSPDDMSGDHRLGVFFNGMDPWTPATATTLNAADTAVGDALRGSATYSGGATGVYVDGDDSGLFTADATLTADFDKATNGADDAVDYMISGRIDNFRGTDGVYLGSDTQASPNDPSAGNNDWVVELGAFDFGTNTDGAIGATATSGSADGVSWTGMWNGHMFGPSTDADGDPIAPSGVAGRFWAETEDLDDDNTNASIDDNPVTAVVGAFGATKDD